MAMVLASSAVFRSCTTAHKAQLLGSVRARSAQASEHVGTPHMEDERTRTTLIFDRTSDVGVPRAASICTIIPAILTHSKPQMHGEVEVQLLSFLTLALDADDQLHVPAAFSLSTQRRGVSVGPRAALDIVNRKMSYWYRDWNPGPHTVTVTISTHQPTASSSPALCYSP